MGIKYGKKMRPWECIVKMANDVSGEEGMFGAEHDNCIEYNFITKNKMTGKVVREREPRRCIILQQPHSYTGQFGLRGFDDQCFDLKS